MVTKRLLSPRELKPPPSLLVSWAVASAPTHDWASFRSGSGQTEPAAEVSLAPAALWFPEGITNPLPVQIKGTIVPRENLLESNAGSWEGKGIHSLVTVLRLGWESLRLGRSVRMPVWFWQASRALHSTGIRSLHVLGWDFCAASFGCSSDPVLFTVRYIIHPTVSPPAQIYRLPVLSFSSCSSKSLVRQRLSPLSFIFHKLDMWLVSPRSEDLQDKCLSTEGQWKHGLNPMLMSANWMTISVRVH